MNSEKIYPSEYCKKCLKNKSKCSCVEDSIKQALKQVKILNPKKNNEEI